MPKRGTYMTDLHSGNNGGFTLGDRELGLKISRLFLTLEWCLKSLGTSEPLLRVRERFNPQ